MCAHGGAGVVRPDPSGERGADRISLSAPGTGATAGPDARDAGRPTRRPSNDEDAIGDEQLTPEEAETAQHKRDRNPRKALGPAAEP